MHNHLCQMWFSWVQIIYCIDFQQQDSIQHVQQLNNMCYYEVYSVASVPQQGGRQKHRCFLSTKPTNYNLLIPFITYLQHDTTRSYQQGNSNSITYGLTLTKQLQVQRIVVKTVLWRVKSNEEEAGTAAAAIQLFRLYYKTVYL